MKTSKRRNRKGKRFIACSFVECFQHIVEAGEKKLKRNSRELSNETKKTKRGREKKRRRNLFDTIQIDRNEIEQQQKEQKN